MIGVPPVKGLTWEKDRKVWVFWCVGRQCSRRQRYAPEGSTQGVTQEEAEHFGWRMLRGKWHCPFCTGNLNNLRRLIMDYKHEPSDWNQEEPEGE